jgi:hypothetical protein
MIPVGREDKALLESNLSARPMAGNNREHPAWLGAPAPLTIRLFSAFKAKNS